MYIIGILITITDIFHGRRAPISVFRKQTSPANLAYLYIEIFSIVSTAFIVSVRIQFLLAIS